LEKKLQEPAPAPAVILALVRHRMRSLLRARDYAQAINFAQEQIKRDSGVREDLGKEIKDEVERLAAADQRDPSALAAALQLIDQARKMQPTLARHYLDQLDVFENDIRKRLPSTTP
jgi:hypothetical protein